MFDAIATSRQTYFSRFGRVVDCVAMTDRATGFVRSFVLSFVRSCVRACVRSFVRSFVECGCVCLRVSVHDVHHACPLFLCCHHARLAASSFNATRRRLDRRSVVCRLLVLTENQKVSGSSLFQRLMKPRRPFGSRPTSSTVLVRACVRACVRVRVCVCAWPR